MQLNPDLLLFAGHISNKYESVLSGIVTSDIFNKHKALEACDCAFCFPGRQCQTDGLRWRHGTGRNHPAYERRLSAPLYGVINDIISLATTAQPGSIVNPGLFGFLQVFFFLFNDVCVKNSHDAL